MRIVLDTNVLIAALIARGFCHILLEQSERLCILLVCGIVLSTGTTIFGQSKWYFYTAPDKSFRVELPTRKVTYIPPNSKELHDTFIEKDVAVYMVPAHKDHGNFPPYSVNVFDLSSLIEKERKNVLDVEEWIWYFALMVLGDDDEPGYLSSSKKVRINGIQGYEFANIDDDGPLFRYSRGRLFLRGNMLYILCFEGSSKDDLKSAAANRFLDSFQPLSSKKARAK